MGSSRLENLMDHWEEVMRLMEVKKELLAALKEVEFGDEGVRCPQCGYRSKHQGKCIVGLAIAKAEGGAA